MNFKSRRLPAAAPGSRGPDQLSACPAPRPSTIGSPNRETPSPSSSPEAPATRPLALSRKRMRPLCLKLRRRLSLYSAAAAWGLCDVSVGSRSPWPLLFVRAQGEASRVPVRSRVPSLRVRWIGNRDR
ncbi:hypothetical protein BV20DRAFT_508516 [Pilatotrama ljubarskyi]|nr:hypothetical protein BV20DRAFT_508516 [Pilatotrama ljubarskyi]